MSAIKPSAAGSMVGVSISLSEIAAYDSRIGVPNGPRWRMTLDAPAADGTAWQSLTDALRALSQAVDEERGQLAVALFPPAAEVRRLDVPPLTDDELESVLARNAQRYFVNARGAQLVGVSASEGRRQEGEGVVAAAAPVWLIRLVSAAARDAGWKLMKIVPAEAAWVAAATSALPNSERQDVQLLVHHDDHTDYLHIAKGRLQNLRRFRGATNDVAMLAAATQPEPGQHQGTRTLAAIGHAVTRKEWNSLLTARGIASHALANLPADVSGEPLLVAAAFAPEAHDMVLRTDEMRADDLTRRARTMRMFSVAAALLLMAAAGFRLWDVKRELAAVQQARQSLKPQLATTLVGRTSVETVTGQLQMLASTERASVRWSHIIAELTDKLPDDAYLTGFRARGDSVVFDGIAERAARVFPAVENIDAFAGTKAAAPVRREGDSMERFSLAARVRMDTLAADRK